jgi:hypothetical protein
VLVVGPENKVLKRAVTLGPVVWRTTPGRPGGWTIVNPKPAEKAPAETPMRSVVAVVKGLAATDVVIVNGLQKTRPGAAVVPDEWTMRVPK